ncbi:unnamed protein product [Cylicostephanus goldi]|uniref:26S proteasome non-ATPase regulatory subunit 5 n=1 Tax=Cylicostephanus goldi TaxID=71465 RepID=A0A3P6TIU2_CYLGO|nr:unnamed protein product [Cylicostephanus goldi]
MAPLLQRLVDELNSDDVLVRLAAMDALSDAAIASPESAAVINDSGAPQKVCEKRNFLYDYGALQIYDLLQHSRDAPDGGFIYPSCVKFLGTLSRVYPEVINNFPMFVPAVFDMVRHFDQVEASQRVLAFDTFAQIAYKAEAKQNLHNLLGEQGITRTMQAFSAAVSSGPVELRVRHVDALAVLFEKGAF